MVIHESVFKSQGLFRTGNLLKLARYLLEQQPKNFDMGFFSRRKDGTRLPLSDITDMTGVAECGAVGCAIGHGPAAGVPALPGEDWTAYRQRAFIASGEDHDQIEVSNVFWNWCFASQWTSFDNTAAGAGLRIAYYLQNGLTPDSRKAAWHVSHKEMNHVDHKTVSQVLAIYRSREAELRAFVASDLRLSIFRTTNLEDNFRRVSVKGENRE